MSVRPRFGGTLQSPEYYAAASVICNTLREYSTLNVIASHMNSQGLVSPSGKPWNKSRVANFLRSPHYISTK